MNSGMGEPVVLDLVHQDPELGKALAQPIGDRAPFRCDAVDCSRDRWLKFTRVTADLALAALSWTPRTLREVPKREILHL